jgi:hypothetical protein
MIEVRRVRPDEYADAGEVTASAWQPIGSPDDPNWLAFRARVADIALRDRIASVYVATEGGHILGSVTLEVDARLADEDNPAPVAQTKRTSASSRSHQRRGGEGSERASSANARRSPAREERHA